MSPEPLLQFSRRDDMGVLLTETPSPQPGLSVLPLVLVYQERAWVPNCSLVLGCSHFGCFLWTHLGRYVYHLYSLRPLEARLTFIHRRCHIRHGRC